MTIARAQMYRQLYQMGGQGIMQLGNGQEEPIFPRLETLSENLGQAEQTLGTPSNDQFNMSSITTAFTGRPTMNMGGRMGYQEGDMAMMQPEGIMNAMPGAMQQEAGGMMQEGGTEQTALLTIIQLLIEQGVPPEQAQELALQILQVFAQGGQPAVEEFANQLEQEEGMPENRTMMAGGGITGLYPRQGFFVKGVVKAISGAVKGVASAVKSVAKSPIGMIALSIAAPYALSALTGGAFATFGNAALGQIGGAALRAGISNLAIQGITTGKINPKQALLAAAAGGALSGIQGVPTGGEAMYTDYGPGTGALTSGVTDIGRGVVQPGFEPIDSGSYSTNVQVGAPPTVPQPGIIDKTLTGIRDFGTKLMSDPVGTIKTGIGSIYDTATETIQKNPLLSVGGAFLAGQQFRAPLPGENLDEYNRLKEAHDAQVAGYITQYGRGAKVYSPGEFGLYAREKAIDPFAGLTTYAANGGRIGYEDGSMPMGEPRKNPAGIMELDYRAKGGFVPPIGIKEKADDIPAMLSNNEFVFTADAVRNAGGGNVNKGAERMYSLMKQLEAGGIV